MASRLWDAGSRLSTPEKGMLMNTRANGNKSERLPAREKKTLRTFLLLEALKNEAEERCLDARDQETRRYFKGMLYAYKQSLMLVKNLLRK